VTLGKHRGNTRNLRFFAGGNNISEDFYITRDTQRLNRKSTVNAQKSAVKPKISGERPEICGFTSVFFFI
jgi:hypothetical protein